MMMHYLASLRNSSLAVYTTRINTGSKAIKAVKELHYTAMILDLGLPDMTGFELLQYLSTDEDVVLPPVIVYTGKDLSNEEHQLLQDLTHSVVIKSARSPERLLDEVGLFINPMSSSKYQQIGLISEDEYFVKLQGRTILLVDDDMRNTFSLAKVLRKKDLIIHIATGGKQALKTLAEQSGIDLILMDIMMPEMDGYETMQLIRAKQQFNHLPIIAVTANAMSGDKEKCLKAGANDYISKPVDIPKLLSKMQVWL